MAKGRFTIIHFMLLAGLVLLCVVLLNAVLVSDVLEPPNKTYDIRQDGFIVLKNILSKSDLQQLQTRCRQSDYPTTKRLLIHNQSLLKTIRTCLNDNDYVFQDYVWIIKKSSVHTCHRDNNGDFFNPNQKHPSYTLLVYLEDADKCLGVVPTSHHDVNSYGVNLQNVVKYLPCRKGDAILFNANLIHVGALNEQDNLRIQMKITHKDDLGTLSYYQNYNKILEQENKLPMTIKHVQKNISCMFPFVSNLTQSENIRTARGSGEVQIGLGQKIWSYLFYGNANYYDLPNAF